jgi:hypothetical protein
MSSPYGPNDPQGYPGQPYPGRYGQQPGGEQQPGWDGQPQQGQPQQGYPGQQQPYGAPGPQQPYGAPGQPPYGSPNPPQYGQPGGSSPFGAPGQQFGQQPGPYGQPNTPKKSRTPLIATITGVVVVIIILLVTAFVAPGFAKTKVLNASSVQDGVQKILTDTYKLSNVSKVSCPTGQEVKNGGTFTCKATIAGKDTDVKVTITDDNGTYQVGRP